MTQTALGRPGQNKMGGSKGEERVFFFFIVRKVIAQLVFYRLPIISEWSLISVLVGERKNQDNFCHFRVGSMHACRNLPS